MPTRTATRRRPPPSPRAPPPVPTAQAAVPPGTRPPYVTATLDAFAENLKIARQAAGLAQSALAAAAGVRESYISMLERGQRTPPLDTIAVLAHALGMTPANLIRPQ